jgi:hypothetical protein
LSSVGETQYNHEDRHVQRKETRFRLEANASAPQKACPNLAIPKTVRPDQGRGRSGVAAHDPVHHHFGDVSDAFDAERRFMSDRREKMKEHCDRIRNLLSESVLCRVMDAAVRGGLWPMIARIEAKLKRSWNPFWRIH